MTKIAINGFGRIGRCVARAIVESGRDDIQLVAVNDLADPENLAYLLRFDSVHGRFPGTVEVGDGTLDMGQGKVRVSSERDIGSLDWEGVDIVLECTGLFTDRDAAARHLDRGAGKVLVSAPAKGGVKTVVYGVNHDTLDANDKIVSNASCTTNALAPLAKILHSEFGIQQGFMTTIHAYTSNQPTLDRPSPKDWLRGRAAAINMVPTSTGAARAIGLVLPELDGRLDGAAIRVPTPNVSVVDLCARLERTTDADAVNAALSKAASGSLNGVMQVLAQSNVSTDLNHDPHSCSIAPGETTVVGGDFVRVLGWYDNEWGFSNRMVDVARAMSAL